MKTLTEPHGQSLSTETNVPFTSTTLLSCRMHILRSTGILQRLNTNIETQLPKNEISFESSMDFTSVAPIFGILAVGTIGAISVLLLEFGLHKKKTRISKTLR
jgi:hypothetical protein